MKTPTKVSYLELETTCVGCGQRRWDQLMQDAVKANKRTINKLVQEHLPDLYHGLALDYYNPYNYLKTKTHLILVHSSIEYFLRYKT